VATVAIFGLAELGARTIEPDLPRVPKWADYILEAKVAQLDAIHATGQHTDVVFVGSSVTHGGVDVQRFLDETPNVATAYNAAINGFSPIAMRAWVDDVVYEAACPRVVVLAISPIDFNDAGPQQPTEAYLANRGRRERLGLLSLGERLEGVAEQHSALMRTRTLLRQPAYVYRHLRGELVPTFRVPFVHPQLGYSPIPPQAKYTELRNRAAVLTTELHYGGEQARALNGLIRELQGLGVQPVVVELPVLKREFFELVPDGSTGLLSFRQELRRVAARNDVPLVLTRDAVSTRTDFLDPMHLSAAGAAAVTSQLARDIDPIVAALPPAEGTCDR
jgi:hypothetical protein